MGAYLARGSKHIDGGYVKNLSLLRLHFKRLENQANLVFFALWCTSEENPLCQKSEEILLLDHVSLLSQKRKYGNT